MDSGNSGSIQSSSGGGGGDEDYDSRGESISPFLNPSGNFGSIPHTQIPASPGFFDLLSQSRDIFSQSLANNAQYNNNNSNNNNNNLVWPVGFRSATDHHQANYGGFVSLDAPSSSTVASSSSSMANSNVQRRCGSEHGLGVVIKNPKKRSRASRRAPTTVLTTDTSNFRQMVQEFTGIPAAPFSGTTYSRRLDHLFSSAAARPGPSLDPLYPLRPSAQKLQLPPFPGLLNASMVDALAPAINSSGQSCLDGGIPKLQNQILAFQPMLQPSVEPLENMSHGQANLGGQFQLRHDDDSAGRQGHYDGNNNNNNNSGSFKLNPCSASTSQLHPEKGLENV